MLEYLFLMFCGPLTFILLGLIYLLIERKTLWADKYPIGMLWLSGLISFILVWVPTFIIFRAW